MYDIFLSYATKDRERVQPLFEALTKQGWTVFWDHLSIRVGKNWSVELEQAINASRCVVVVWSEHSIKSEYVREEANFAKRRGVLLPICLDKVEPPFGFTLRQATDFSQWNQKADHPAFIRLATEIYALLNTGQTSPPFEPVLAPKAKLRWPLYAGVSLVALAAAGGYQFLPKLDQALEQRQAKLLNHEPSAKPESITDQPKLSGSQLPYGIEMVDIVPAGQTGKFMMGCDPKRDEVDGGCQDHEKPPHPVTLQPYQLSKTEVTVGQFRAFVDATGYETTAENKSNPWCSVLNKSGTEWEQKQGRSWRKLDFVQSDNHPVVCVSWKDTQAYIEWLNQMLKPNGLFRLPTEAEWEYAARDGINGVYPWGYNISSGCIHENLGDQTLSEHYPSWSWNIVDCNDGVVHTAPVSSFRPNFYGLHDMGGNVSEWVQDRYDKEYYSISPVNEPTGPISGTKRVARGGAWYGFSRGLLGTSARMWDSPDNRHDTKGFRVAKSKS